MGTRKRKMRGGREKGGKEKVEETTWTVRGEDEGGAKGDRERQEGRRYSTREGVKGRKWGMTWCLTCIFLLSHNCSHLGT